MKSEKNPRNISPIIILLLIGTISLPTTMAEVSGDVLTLTYATFFGGNNFDDGYAIALDSDDNVYVAGATQSSDFPHLNGFGTVNASHVYRDVHVAKFSSSGDLLFSTIFGGIGHDTATELALNSEGKIVVVGITLSKDFPTTENAFNRSYSGGAHEGVGDTCCGDAFLSIISNDGTELLYSTYFGGSLAEADIGLSIDNNDQIYITGITSSEDFPVTNDAYQSTLAGGLDYFTSIFSSDGSTLVYSTYIGGSGDELVKGGGVGGHNIIKDSENNIHIAGGTHSSDFPVTANAQDKTLDGGEDAFYLKFSPTSSELLYSTYLGGDDVDSGWGISVDSSNNAYIAGSTKSSDFPTTSNSFQDVNQFGGCVTPGVKSGCGDAFFTVISSSYQIVYSSYIGGSGVDLPLSISADLNGGAMISGFTNSHDFPVFNADQETYGGGTFDAFVAQFNSNFELEYATYIGGSTDWELANDITYHKGSYYATGFTQSSDFPVSEDAYDITHAGNSDIIILKFSYTTRVLDQENQSNSNKIPYSLHILITLFILSPFTKYIRVKHLKNSF